MRLWGRLEHPTYSIPPKKQRVPSKAQGRYWAGGVGTEQAVPWAALTSSARPRENSNQGSGRFPAREQGKARFSPALHGQQQTGK